MELTAGILLPMLQHSSPILVAVVSQRMLVHAKGGKSCHFQMSKIFKPDFLYLFDPPMLVRVYQNA